MKWFRRVLGGEKHENLSAVTTELRSGITPPVFVFELGTLHAFSTVEEAESAWEAYDISDLFGFDSKGKWLRFYKRSERMDLGIGAQPESELHRFLSYGLLVYVLFREGEDPEWLKRASFDELVRRAYKRFSES